MGVWRSLFGTAEETDDGLTPRQRLLVETAEAIDQLDPWALPAVVAARQLLADTTAMMPLAAHDGTRRLERTPPILLRPNSAEPYRRTMERLVNSMTRHGTAWMRIRVRGADGYPLSLEHVDNGRVTYRLTVDQQRLSAVWIDGRPVDLLDVVWCPMILEGQPVGTSPLQEIETALEQLAAVYRYSSEYYLGAGVPPYAVIHPNRLTNTQATDYSEAWALARAERRPAQLSGGVSLETYDQPSAADVLMLDAINYLDAVVARVLLIPPSLLNVLAQSSLTYSTTLDEFRRWLQLGLYPGVLSRLEATFTDLLPPGTSAVFDTSNLVRMDLSGRISAYAASISAGIHTVAEVRAMEGLPITPDATPEAVVPNVEGL